jgi:hypothetical protein
MDWFDSLGETKKVEQVPDVLDFLNDKKEEEEVVSELEMSDELVEVVEEKVEKVVVDGLLDFE